MTDTDFLKERLDKKDAQNALNTNTVVKPTDATSLLKNINDETPDIKEQIRQRRLHKKAITLDSEDTTREEKEAEAERKKAAKDARDKSQNVTDIVNRNVDKVSTATLSLADRIGSIKTSGGISLLLVILMILVFIVIRVNASGDTRLKQFWYMLNGRTQLQGKVTLDNPLASAGAIGDFGNTNNTVNGASGNFEYTPSTNGYRGNTTF